MSKVKQNNIKDAEVEKVTNKKQHLVLKMLKVH